MTDIEKFMDKDTPYEEKQRILDNLSPKERDTFHVCRALQDIMDLDIEFAERNASATK